MKIFNFFDIHFLSIFMILISVIILILILIYWFVTKQYQKPDNYKKIIATSFIYSFTKQQFYFETRPWFINQHRNSLQVILPLMTQNSSREFQKLIDRLKTSRSKITPQNPQSFKINFYLNKRIENCKIEILKFNPEKRQFSGTITNLYET